MRTGIFGGTFNPIHSAHLEMARQAADQFQLDRVLFIPAGNPPHKRGVRIFVAEEAQESYPVLLLPWGRGMSVLMN